MVGIPADHDRDHDSKNAPIYKQPFAAQRAYWLGYYDSSRPVRQEWIAAAGAKIGLSADKITKLQRYDEIAFDEAVKLWKAGPDNKAIGEPLRGIDGAHTWAIADLLGQADWIRFQAAMYAAQDGTLDELDIKSVRTNYGPDEGEADGLPATLAPSYRPLFH